MCIHPCLCLGLQYSLISHPLKDSIYLSTCALHHVVIVQWIFKLTNNLHRTLPLSMQALLSWLLPNTDAGNSTLLAILWIALKVSSAAPLLV